MEIKFRIEKKGGTGSGHHGHSGRPGKQGGSMPGSGGGGYEGGDTGKSDRGREQWQGYAPVTRGNPDAPITTHRKLANKLNKISGVNAHLPRDRGKFEARARFSSSKSKAVASALQEAGFHELTPKGGFPESAGRQGLFGKNNYFYQESKGRVFFNPESNIAAYMSMEGNRMYMSIINQSASRIRVGISQSD